MCIAAALRAYKGQGRNTKTLKNDIGLFEGTIEKVTWTMQNNHYHYTHDKVAFPRTYPR